VSAADAAEQLEVIHSNNNESSPRRNYSINDATVCSFASSQCSLLLSPSCWPSLRAVDSKSSSKRETPDLIFRVSAVLRVIGDAAEQLHRVSYLGHIVRGRILRPLRYF
jgi:hypothetical protein